MKKVLTVLAMAIALSGAAFAQEEKQSPVIFFDETVPRYEGVAAGLFFMNQYPLGGWSDFALTNIGGGADLEYTLPHFLPGGVDLGFSVHGEYSFTFPKADTTLKSHSDIRTYAGMFLRMPFSICGQNFAFQPELGYGIDFSFCEGQNGSEAHGLYVDQMVFIAPAIRYIPGGKTVELELAPFWSLSPEQYSNAIHDFGFRIGVVWHFTNFFKGQSLRAEEKRLAALKASQEEEARRLEDEQKKQQAEIERLRKEAEAADEAEKERLAEELRKAQEAAKAAEEARLAAEAEVARLAEEERKAEEARKAEESLRAKLQSELSAALRDQSLLFGVNRNQLSDFTPDADGSNDSIVFKLSRAYMSEAPKSWKLSVIDPKGNTFKTFSGEGFPPEQIVWDGKGDDGSVVFSRENYKAVLNVALSDKDIERLNRSQFETTVEGSVNIATGIVMTPTGKNEWNITMTSITFDPDKATFNRLSKEKRDELYAILDDIAAKLSKIPGAKITIEGYANNVSGTEKEETEELIPLSQIRAEAIAKLLVERGLSESAVEAVGKGGANPLASREDKDNWWKNRRIEIVIKK